MRFSYWTFGGMGALFVVLIIGVLVIDPDPSVLQTSPFFTSEPSSECLEFIAPCLAACEKQTVQDECLSQCELDYDTCLTENTLAD
jgi:hypothetical protein